ncbi:MAG TPA: DUF2339 domain-containing protein [Thermoanaerobaculia bacterium]|nr:DUF2339 domain-containing protein [Thermoanaerobaculia bacterium]
METGCYAFVSLILLAAVFALALTAKQRADRAAAEIASLRGAIDALGRRVSELRKHQAPAGEPASTATGATEAPVEPVAVAAAPSPVPPEPVAPPPTPAPPSPAKPEPVVDVPWPVFPGLIPQAPPAGQQHRVELAAAKEAAPEPPPHAPRPPEPPKPPTPPRVPPVTPPPPKKPFDWEGLVGVKLFSWIGGVMFVGAAVLFLRYSVAQGWIGPKIKATIGILTGIGLLVACEFLFRRNYRTTGNALNGAGIAILYSTLFASHALWNLLGTIPTFALMLLVTAIAVALSIYYDSIFIALLGLLGGFSTPALLSTGENNPIGLFGYLLLLNAGLAWVAYKKRWPVLTALSLALTVVYQWVWIGKFLDAAQLPIAVGIFVVFALMATTSLWIGRGRRDAAQLFFERTAAAGAALPLLFALFTAAIPAYGARFHLLFGFLLALTAGLAIVAAARGPQWLHLLGGVCTFLVFAVWLTNSYVPAAWPAILAWLAVFVLFYLGAPVIANRLNVPFVALGTQARFIAPLLLFVFPALVAIEKRAAAPALLFSVLFLLLACTAAYAIISREGVVYFIAAFFAMATEAVWSAKYLSPERLKSALVLYLLFALFFLGVPILARRLRKPLQPEGGIAVVLLLSLGLLFFLALGSTANTSLWGLALLLAILNIGTIAEASAGGHPILTKIGMILSWIVIAVWWASADILHQSVNAMMVVGGFGLIVVAGSVWGQRRTSASDLGDFGTGIYLGLVGHLFLLFVATQPTLVATPWPMLAVLAVLDLAIGVAALYLRRGRLFIAAILASQVVLIAWTGTNVHAQPASGIAGAYEVAISLFAFIWLALGMRKFRGNDRMLDQELSLAVATSLFGGEIVAMTINGFASQPVFTLLLALTVFFVIATLVLAWITEWHIMAILAVPLAFLATLFLRHPGLSDPTPTELATFASAVYAWFILYPLLLGRRVKQSLLPHLAAVLASVPFFLAIHEVIKRTHRENIVGALPLFQAALLMVLLIGLLRIQAPGQRLLSRLALVAGAALAFVTLAIPLQLDKQWITIAWALEAAALVWLFRRIPHRGLLLWSAGLFAAVFARLMLNEALLSYHPPSHVAILNWYLYTYLVAAAAFFAAAMLLPASEREQYPLANPALASGGTILLFALVNIEIADYYSKGQTLTFNFFSSSLAQDLTYTIFWALFALGLLIAGIILHSRSARVAALCLLLVTIFKCFLHDLGRLKGLYQIGSLLGLAISLILVGLLLQRFVLVKRPKEEVS